MPHPAHVEGHPLVKLPRLLDDEGVRGPDLREEWSHGVGRLGGPVGAQRKPVTEVKISLGRCPRLVITLLLLALSNFP